MMDTKELFNPTGENKDTPKSDEVRIVGITESLPLYPLIYGLVENKFEYNFQISAGSLSENVHRLREGEIEIALISSLDYALNKETWNIIPGLCLSSPGEIKHIQLFFKKGLKDIHSVAVNRQATSEKVLLQILMKEKFMISPEYIVMDGDVDKMLSKADAVLAVGENALKNYTTHSNRLDLAEEWHDLTGFPFVNAFWAGREHTVFEEDIKNIQLSFDLGKKNLQKIAEEYAKNHSEDWIFYHDYLTRNLSFSLTEREEEGLNEFFHYAFFYGFSEYIPDLLYYNFD